MYLSLPIPENGGPVDLESCLEKFVEPELLEDEDSWFCPRCKQKRPTRKTLSIAKLPSVLLVHLKRFYFQGPFKNKIETFVDFPIHGLDITRFMPAYAQQIELLNSGGGPSGRKEKFIYDLYSVSVSNQMKDGRLGSVLFTL